MMRRIGTVGVLVLVVGATVVGLATATKHQDRPPTPDATVTITVGVESRSGHTSANSGSLIHAACITQLPPGINSSTEVIDGNIAVTLTPAPDNESLRPFTGCLNDITVDHLKAWVINVARTNNVDTTVPADASVPALSA